MFTKRLLFSLFIVLLAVVAAAALIPLIIGWHYEKKVVERLSGWVYSASDSLYTLSVQTIDISNFSRNITLTGLELRPDSVRLERLRELQRLPRMVVSGSVAVLELEGLRLADLLIDREVKLKLVEVSRPVLTIHRTAKRQNTDPEMTTGERLLAGIDVSQLRISGPRVVYKDYVREDSFSILWSGGLIAIDDWSYQPGNTGTAGGLLFARAGEIAIDSAVFSKVNSLYAFRTGKMKFESSDNSLMLQNLRIEPAMSRESYYRRLGYRDELFRVHLPSVLLSGLDWARLAAGELIVQMVRIQNPVTDIYLDRNLPPEPFKLRRFPDEILMQLGFPVWIQQCRIRNGRLSYTELSDRTGSEAELPFKDFDLNLTNITNMPRQLQRDCVCKADLRAKLFESEIALSLKFFLKNANGSFQAEGRQQGMDGSKLNSITRPVALMDVKSLDLKNVKFSLSSNGRDVKGDFLFLYDDLDLRMLKLTDRGALADRGFMSFIINKALLYPANPEPGKPERRVTTTLTRGADQSFFNLLWTSIRTGALLTAGRNPGVAAMVSAKKKPSNP